MRRPGAARGGARAVPAHDRGEGRLPTWSDRRLGSARPPGFVMINLSSPPATVESYDERLNLRWRAPLPPNRAPAALAVDRVGNTLVLFDGDMNTAPKTADGMWIDRTGAAGPVFHAVGPMDHWAPLRMDLTQRVGSGPFVAGSERLGQHASLAITVTP